MVPGMVSPVTPLALEPVWRAGAALASCCGVVRIRPLHDAGCGEDPVWRPYTGNHVAHTLGAWRGHSCARVRVFVAGGSGVVGRPLVKQLVAAGHQVTATTRAPGKAAVLERLGATVAVVDALDSGAVQRAVEQAAPQAI